MSFRYRAAVLALAFVVLSSLGGVAELQAQNTNYQVFAFNNLGMHCYDNDFSVFSLLPPFNVLNAQVVLRGAKPTLLDNNAVQLSYQGVNSHR